MKAVLDALSENERPFVAAVKDTATNSLSALILRESRGEITALPIPADIGDLDAELEKLAGQCAAAFRSAYLPASRDDFPEVVTLPIETFDGALAANARYLERQPVIEGLCYASASSMITGGKHSGKSTLARYLAVCVAKGWQFLERDVQQGPVIYIASEDEEMVARSELIKLGWTESDPIFFVGKSQIPDSLDEQAVLNLLAEEIGRRGAKVVVIDMLFDFIPVRDELGYAETRRAVGLIQHVASETGIHIVVLHHAPKHASLSADAVITALGSQGLAARVSPIILTRRYGPGVHAIVSSSVRDPRGKAIPDSRLSLSEDGTLRLGGAFKAYMLAEVYSDRVMDLIEEEPGQEFTVNDVMEKMGIEYEPARATLRALHVAGRVSRGGAGKKRDPFRYSIPLTEIRPANDFGEISNTPRREGTGGLPENPEPPFQRPSTVKRNLTPPGDDQSG